MKKLLTTIKESGIRNQDFKSQILNRKSLLLFPTLLLFVLCCNSSQAQSITRAQIISNAVPYTTYTFTTTASNIKHSVSCSGVGNIITPSWVVVGNNTSMPYCWGGFSTLASFTSGLTHSKSAGDDDCTTGGDGSESCAVGVDCSGFVSRTWGRATKESTSSIPNISTALGSATLTQPGDCFNKAGSHVRLVETNYGNGNYRVIESSANGWHVAYNTYTASQLSAYVPRKYVNVTNTSSCGTPSGLTASSITLNSATLNWSAVSGATSYNVQYKPTTSSTWTMVTSTTTSKSVSGLTASTAYQFQVQAVCSSTGTYSSAVSFTTLSASCGTPTGLSTTSITSGGATLNWVAVSGATSYNVQYKPTTSSTWTTVTSITTSKSVSSLSASTAYQFQVQAVCSSAGSYSSVAAFTTAASTGSNDDCANAQTLTPNATCVSTSGSIAGATSGGLPKASCDGYSGTPALKDVWFKFQATSATHTIKVTPSASFDVVLSLYTSCGGGQIGCSDNGGGPGAAETINATTLTVGTTYYIRVYSYGSTIPATTTFTICVTTPTTNSTANCDITLKTTIEGFKVYKHNPSGAIMFRAKMAIDADGSPRAYGPNNTGLDFTANAGAPGNWWGVVADGNGNPVIQGSSDPYPGMYVSTTSLINSSYAATNPLRYANSETLPFFVLPSAVTFLGGISLGDIAYVYNTSNGQGCYAIFADGGPAGKLGEGSIYLANQLGINSNARTGGAASGIIDYIVFPQSGSGQGTFPTVSQINNAGTAKINGAGGTSITNCIPSTSQLTNLTGINSDLPEKSALAFEVFPNPFDGKILNGKFSDAIDLQMRLQIFDMLGREVFVKEIFVEAGNFSLSLAEENLKPGVYSIVGVTNNNRFTKKVIVR